LYNVDALRPVFEVEVAGASTCFKNVHVEFRQT